MRVDKDSIKKLQDGLRVNDTFSPQDIVRGHNLPNQSSVEIEVLNLTNSQKKEINNSLQQGFNHALPLINKYYGRLNAAITPANRRKLNKIFSRGLLNIRRKPLTIEDVEANFQQVVKNYFNKTSLLNGNEVVLHPRPELEGYPFLKFFHHFIDYDGVEGLLPAWETTLQKKDDLERILLLPARYLDKGVHSEAKQLLAIFDKAIPINHLEHSAHNMTVFATVNNRLRNYPKLQGAIFSLAEIETQFEHDEELEAKRKLAEEVEKNRLKQEKKKKMEMKAFALGIEAQEAETLLFAPYELSPMDHFAAYRIERKSLVNYAGIRSKDGAAQAKDLAFRMKAGFFELSDVAANVNRAFADTRVFGDAIFSDNILRVYENILQATNKSSKSIKNTDTLRATALMVQDRIATLAKMAVEQDGGETLNAAVLNRYNEVFEREGAYSHPNDEAKEVHLLIMKQPVKQFAQQVLEALTQAPILLITLTGDINSIRRAQELFDELHQLEMANGANNSFEKDMARYKINKLAEKAFAKLAGYDVAFAGEEPRPQQVELDEEDDFGTDDVEPDEVVEEVFIPYVPPPAQPPVNVNIPAPVAEEQDSEVLADPVFDKLASQVDDFLLSAVELQPPRDGFKCILELKQGYPITMTLVDNAGDMSRLSLNPETDDLDRALELKIALQSYVLNNNDLIFPYRHIRASKERGALVQIDEAMPIAKPDKIVLLRGGGIYRMGMSFVEHNMPVEVSFSLGVLARPENIELAKERMELLTDYLADERSRRRWITKREAIDFVRTMYPDAQWERSKSFYLDGYDNVSKLPSLSPSRQEPTTLSRVSLKYEDGVNPSYILSYQLAAMDKSVRRGASVRLHTASEDIAKERAVTSVESLKALFKEKADSDATWSLDADGRWIEISEEKRGRYVDPKGLSDVLNDTVHFEKGITVALDVDALEVKNNDLINFRLIIKRSTNDEASHIVKDIDGHVVQFKAAAAGDEEASRFAHAVGKTFSEYVNDAYGKRTKEGLRKTPQKYHTQTAPRLLAQAVETHKKRFADTIVFDM